MNILPWLVVILVITFIIEVLTVALKMTGMSRRQAKFQVVSILTNTGFTTRESELITQHPTRRKIAQYLMLLGFIGYATLIGFIVQIIQSETVAYAVFSVVFVMFVILALVKNKWLTRNIDKIIERKLKKRIRRKKYRTVADVLKLTKKFGVVEFVIEPNCKLIGKKLKKSRLKENNILVLNVDKGSKIIHIVDKSYVFEIGDKVTVYGKVNNIKKLIITQYRK